MAAIPQSKAVVGFAIQSAKGTPAAASTHRLFLAGGTPVHAVSVKEDFLETSGYQAPQDAYISSVEGTGSPQFYCMPSSIDALFYAILGAKAVTGVGDPYTHTNSEATDVPYVTVWGSVGNGLFEQFNDCKVTSLVLHGENGKPLLVTPKFQGGVPSFLTAEETTATPEQSDRFLYYDGKAQLLMENVPVPLMKSFDLTIERNGMTVFGDALTPVDTMLQALAVSLTMTTKPADFAFYNRVVYGSASPSNAAPATSVPDTLGGSPAGVDLKFTRSTNRTLELLIPRVQRDPFVDAVSATPGPLERTTTFKAYKPTDGSTIMQAIVKNAVAITV